MRLEWNPTAQEEIAVDCLTYLSFDTFRSGSCSSDESFEQRRADNQFLDYSARYWSEHVRPVQDHPRISELGLALLRSISLVDSVVQYVLLYKYKYISISRNLPSGTMGIHLAARYGLLYLVKRLLTGESEDSSVKVDPKDRYSLKPLYYAARGGHEAVAKVLIEAGANINASDNIYGTALQEASHRGHEAVVKLLIEAGADINASGDVYGNALQEASHHGHEAVVKLLVEAGADANASSSITYGTALQEASRCGHEAVVRLLIGAGASMNPSSSITYGNALQEALYHGHEGVVKLLIEKGADVKALGSELFRSALQRASRGGHGAVVKLLVEAGATQ